MDGKIKWGILGPGNIARRFADALSRCEDAKLYAVASASDAGRAAAFAKEFGAEHAFGSYDRLLDDKNVQAVYIATVNTTHKELIKKCAAAGKPVLCEKPCVLTEADAAELQALSERNGSLIMEAMWTAFLPATFTVKKWIADGRIGSLKGMSLSFAFKGDRSSRRLYERKLAGGGMYDVGVYCIEYAMELTGAYPVRCESISAPQNGVDEYGVLLMRFPGDIIADCKYGVGFYAGGDAYIYGDNGRIFVPEFWSGGRCELYGEDGSLKDSYTDPEENRFIYEIRHFNRLVREGKTMSDIMTLEKTRACAAVFDKIRSYEL